MLVVDDSDDIRSLFTLWLGQQYDVRSAADGVAALDRMDEGVDVVVLDREMPRKDGLEVARVLDDGGHRPAVVMVSGVEPGTELLELPVDDYLQKPVDRAEVLDAVDRASTVADAPATVRRMRALDRRLEVVSEATTTAALVDSEAYQRAVATLEKAPGTSVSRAGAETQSVAPADRPRSSLQRR